MYVFTYVLTYEAYVTIRTNACVSAYVYVYTVCLCLKVYVLLTVWSKQSLVFELFNLHVHFRSCDLCHSFN